MEIKNRVKGLVMKNIDDLIVSHEGLKTLSKFEYEKLKNSFLLNGNILPLVVYGNEVLDGRQRLHVLRELKACGVMVPQQIPCVEIEANDDMQIKKFILQYISQHGKIMKKDLCKMVQDSGLIFSDIMQEIAIPAFLIKHVEEHLT